MPATTSRLAFIAFLSAALGLAGCQKQQTVTDDPWLIEDLNWLTAEDIEQMDGREVIGFFDLTDEVTGERYQVFLLFDSLMRRGAWYTTAPYNLTAFYSTNGWDWESTLLRRGGRTSGISVVFDNEELVHLQLQPYYVTYAQIDHPMREEVHKPYYAILTMRNGKPALDSLGR